MNIHCPICGKPFSPLEAVLSEQDVKFQCHHCWSRIHATGPALRHHGPARPKHASTTRHTHKIPGRK